jgi:MerR family transcriptional regulator, light-induced transcriptional regulator
VNDLLTTAEAAQLAGVGASSVKRWADSAVLRCVRTAGGHRRFLREELERFLREQGGSLTADAPSDWVDLMLAGGIFELQGELLRARDRLGAWYLVAAEVGTALVELGERWARSEISVLEEHMASDKLARAIQRTIESLPSSPENPRAVLATALNDEHTLGLSLVELCLREVGWACAWSGRCTPTQELVAVAESGEVSLLALSASLSSSDPKPLAREARRLGDVCRAMGVELLLGGAGAWPEHPRYGTRLRDLPSLHRLALSLRAAHTSGGGR